MIYALLQNFMKSLKRGVRVIIEGERLSDKIRLFVRAMLRLTSKTALTRFVTFKNTIRALEDFLAKNTIINVHGNKFYCVDSESISILQPEFESWMWRYLKVPKGGVFVDVGGTWANIRFRWPKSSGKTA